MFVGGTRAFFWRFPTIVLAGVLGLGGVLAVGAATSSPTAIPSTMLGGLKWRNVGPFRAGRVNAVAGEPFGDKPPASAMGGSAAVAELELLA